METYRVKDGAGMVSHNGRDYGAGDIIQMSEADASKILHAVEPIVEPIEERPKKNVKKESASVDV